MRDLRGDVDLDVARPDPAQLRPVVRIRQPGRRDLVAGRGALPGELRPVVAVRGRLPPGGREPVIAVGEEVPRDVRLGVGEERQHERLGVPEGVPEIAEARQGLGADAHLLVVARCRDQELVDREARRELRLRVALDRDVRGGPRARPRPPRTPRGGRRSPGRRARRGAPRRPRAGHRPRGTSRGRRASRTWRSSPAAAVQRPTRVGCSRASHGSCSATAPPTRTRIASPSRVSPPSTRSPSDALVSPRRWPSHARCARPFGLGVARRARP